MQYLWIIPVVLLGLFLLYFLMVMGRRKHPGLQKLQGWAYAHRGLHNKEGIPENSMAAFRKALEKGYGIELDVHLLSDGNLAVIHDHSLKRTAGVDIPIESLTTQQLKDYPLEGTQETIPTFSQVLELFAGKAPMIVELKAIGKNYGALVDETCRQLENYPGAYCIESFDPRCIRYLRKHHKHIVRGQLAENFIRRKSKVAWILKFMMSYQLVNFLTLPDFVAYDFTTRKTLGNFLVRKVWGVQGVTWTLRSQADHDQALKEGWLPIFENYEP